MKPQYVISTFLGLLALAFSIVLPCFGEENMSKDSLNEILISIGKDPKERSAFIEQLLLSDIYFLTNQPIEKTGTQVTEEDTSFSLLMLKNDANQIVCPIFSSIDQIRNAQLDTFTHIRLNARTFFENIKDVNVVLNPASEFRYVISSDDIKAFLSLPHPVSVKKSSKISIGQPEKYPDNLIKTATLYLKRFNEIHEAYIALWMLHGENESPHLLIALRGQGDLSKIIPTFSNLIYEATKGEDIFDVVDLSSSKEFTEYFEDVKPFYQREKNEFHL